MDEKSMRRVTAKVTSRERRRLTGKNAQLAGETPALPGYHFNSCKRRATSSAFALLLNALMRK